MRIDKVALSPPLTASGFGACLHINALTACPAASPAYSVLVLRVTGPNLRKAAYVSIGLAGNGVVARTILYSLRTA